jgi:DNA-binding NarL/FixJ family response regulator
MKVVGEAETGEDTIKLLAKLKTDVIDMDIAMSGMKSSHLAWKPCCWLIAFR